MCNLPSYKWFTLLRTSGLTFCVVGLRTEVPEEGPSHTRVSPWELQEPVQTEDTRRFTQKTIAHFLLGLYTGLRKVTEDDCVHNTEDRARFRCSNVKLKSQ